MAVVQLVRAQVGAGVVTTNRRRELVYDEPRVGFLALDGWGGRSMRSVHVIGETAERYRIRAIDYTRLAGRGRFLMAGENALVPKSAVWGESGKPLDSQWGRVAK